MLSSLKSGLGFLVIAQLALFELPLIGAVGTKPDGTRFVESADLLVTVMPLSGTIHVKDKVNNYTWVQRTNTSHTPFANVTLFPAQNAIGFNTSYFPGDGGTSPGQLFTWTELWLDGRKLKVKVNIDDHDTSMGSFDGLEPFQPTSSMSVVLPDFSDGHIYPCNLSSWPHYNLDSLRILNLLMPWAGVVDLADGKGYAVMCDTPYDAQLKLGSVRGLRSPLIAWNPEKGRFGYARSMTYYFTANGGYVALAKAYRERAKEDGLVQKLATKALSRPQITNLYGAPVLWDFYGHLPPQMLRTLGVTKAFYHVERWDQVNHSLRAVAHAGFIADEYDYYTAGPVDGGTQSYQNYHIASNQCVRTPSGSIFEVGSWGARCSEFFLPTAQAILPARLDAFPAGARYIDQMTQNILGHDNGPDGGGSTLECFDANHPKTRTDWVNDNIAFYRWLAEDLHLINGAELGKYYQVPYTEIFHGIGSWFWPWPDVTFPPSRGANTADWNTYDRWAINPAVRVPLWQLVFHDCTIGSWYPWDGNDVCHRFDGHYQDQKDCMNVLYGTPAVFMVNGTAASGSGSQFFNSTFGQRQRWLQSYRNTCKHLETLADKEMIQHSFLSPDRLVQQTKWSDGTTIVANFGPNNFSIDGGEGGPVILPQFGFAAHGSWGEAIRNWDANTSRVTTRLRNGNYWFDDEQMSGTNRIAMAIHRVSPNNLRVNIDQPGSAIAVVINPKRVQPFWDFATTRVWVCSSVNGGRLAQKPWSRAGTNGIQVSGLSGAIVLDVVCEPLPPRLRIESATPSSAVELTLIGTLGREYRVEETANVHQTDWSILEHFLALPNWTNSFSDVRPFQNDAQRFYRAADVGP